MFTARLNGSVVSSELKNHFLQFAASCRIKTCFRKVSEADGGKTVYRKLIDWNEPVRIAKRKDAEDFAAEMQAFAGDWSVVEIERRTSHELAGIVLGQRRKRESLSSMSKW